MAKKILISLSATSGLSSRSTDAFISAVLVMLSKLNGRSTSNFKSDVLSWTKDSVPFMSKFGLSRTATKIFNVYNVKGNILEEMAHELGTALKAKRVEIEQYKDVSDEQVKLLKDIDNQLRTQSVAAWNRIHVNVRNLNNPKLTAAFSLETDSGNGDKVADVSVKKIAESLMTLVTAVTGQTRHFLTLAEVIALRDKSLAKSKQYSALVKQVRAMVKKETFNYVRGTGKSMVPLTELQSFLSKKGIPNNLPLGFVGGAVDDLGKFYTAEGRPLTSVPEGVVKMNPNYDPNTDATYVMKGVDHKRFYRTATFIDSNKDKRFSQVQAFIGKETEHRNAWVKDLSGVGRKPLFAAMVELIHATSSRIGGEGNATAGEPTYGMSTLQVRHLNITPTLVTYDYTGKKLAQQGAKYKINTPTAKKVHAILTELVKGKAPTDNVFTYKGKPLKRAAVNIYLRSIGIELSIHSFRRIAGTKLATEILKRSPFKKSDHPKLSVVEKWVKEALKDVGILLHHRSGENVTSGTAIKAYIDPSVITAFFESLDLRKPSFLKKMI